MNRSLDAAVRRCVLACVGVAQRRARTVLLAYAVTGVLLAAYAVTHLGVNADNTKLLSPDLPFLRASHEFEKYFPAQDNTLFIVVDADSATRARDGARALARRLRARSDEFRDVFMPAAEPFFEERGLLYRTVEETEDLVDHLARLQPLIGTLTQDPSIANLARFIELGLEEERVAETPSDQWAHVFDRIGQATVQVYRGDPVAVSWEDIMVAGSALDPGTRQVIIVEPILDFSSPLPAAEAMETIRAIARELNLTSERGVTVRITGNPALNYEEILAIAGDIVRSSGISLLLVSGLLFVALGSWRLVLAAAVTLVSGIVWTAAFAAAAVGALNLVSISFAVLFIGLGVDFAIHLGMHWYDRVRAGAHADEAMRRAAFEIGTALVLCALTTSIGFYAFVPTEYRGVAELGLIAGTGMFVIVLQTLTLFPAMVEVLVDADHTEVVRARTPRLFRRLAHMDGSARLVVAGFAIGVVASAALLPHVRFDANVLKMRDPNTESVQAFEDLLARSHTSPWSIDVLAPDVESARNIAERLEEVPEVASAVTIADYIPADQEEKIEILAEAAMLLDVPPSANGDRAEIPVAEQVEALRKLRDLLAAATWLDEKDSTLAESARRLRRHLTDFLSRIEREGDPGKALADLQALLLGNVDEQIARLRRALEPEPITLEDLPPALRARMLADDGHARVQVFPRDDLSDTEHLIRFVDAVRAVEPHATGVAVNVLEFGRATARSLRQALALAFVAIAVLLFVLWRRPADVVYAMAPLVAGAVLTCGAMVVFGIAFNFANVIVLPLLVGIGVDSGIHIVSAWHRAGENPESLFDPTTARAVLFSALTTIASFGSLALSNHRGIASLGMLLVVGMVITLACNLVLLPALLALRSERVRSAAKVRS